MACTAVACGRSVHDDPPGLRSGTSRTVDLYQRACDGGDMKRCIDLGVMYEQGRGVAALDETKAVALYQRACDGGNANGCSSLGWAFVQGVGATEDRERGIALLRNGCSRGNAWGCDKLRKMGVAP